MSILRNVLRTNPFVAVSLIIILGSITIAFWEPLTAQRYNYVPYVIDGLPNYIWVNDELISTDSQFQKFVSSNKTGCPLETSGLWSDGYIIRTVSAHYQRTRNLDNGLELNLICTVLEFDIAGNYNNKYQIPSANLWGIKILNDRGILKPKTGFILPVEYEKDRSKKMNVKIMIHQIDAKIHNEFDEIFTISDVNLGKIFLDGQTWILASNEDDDFREVTKGLVNDLKGNITVNINFAPYWINLKYFNLLDNLSEHGIDITPYLVTSDTFYIPSNLGFSFISSGGDPLRLQEMRKNLFLIVQDNSGVFSEVLLNQ